jgi:hypothetical protein
MELVDRPLSVNLLDVRKGLTELREGLRSIRQELNEHFSEVEQNDRYSKQMWGFLGKATRQMEDLNDDVNAADTLFTDVVRYFGEDDKNMSSAEFYGVFKTFITSYRVRDVHESYLSGFLTMGPGTEMSDREQNGCRGEARDGEEEASRRGREIQSEETDGGCSCTGSRGYGCSRQPTGAAAKRQQCRTARPPSASQCHQHERTGIATSGQGNIPRFGVGKYRSGHCARHARTAQDEWFRIRIFRAYLAHDSVGTQAASIAAGYHGCGAGCRAPGRRQPSG